MDLRKLGGQGLVVSEQGLGCMGMTFAYGPADAEESLRTIHRALELGVTLLDTADMYGPYSNELLVGRAVAGRRDTVTLASKVGSEIVDDNGVPAMTGEVNGHPDYIRAGIEGTLRRLGTDHLDLYYLHRVDPRIPVEDSWAAMAELVHEGKVRFLGISEASAATIERAHAVHPVTAVQSEYSLFTRDVEVNGVLETTNRLGIGFVSYSPLGRGFLSGRIRGTDDIPHDDFRRIAPRFQGANLEANLRIVEQLSALAEDRGLSPAQLALAWVLAQSPRMVTIPGTKRRSYLEENLAASGSPLTPEDVALVSRLVPVGIAAGDRYPAHAMTYLDG
ncbi:aldo/keto reductase [Streptomyces albireticuli]|uniref:Aldo/keto reductase n=1 Tax=Streptomyces albireticuli TaxID=1940 RepID=A0A1Z2KYZ5_9ACTN|nr:aldo/keto reductase [Streptomyces albireticuli]ARZ67263.1 aldo/keto reductase [Streptomyces albireticuli]